jgi:microsomal dipeptidase-like Zn-dependent dipeptidase
MNTTKSLEPRACCLGVFAALLVGAAASAQTTGVWGFADLHTHPAAHLAFGADAAGNNGILWGKPGMDLASGASTFNTDMPVCLNTHVVMSPNPIAGGGILFFLDAVPTLPVPIGSFHGAPSDYIQLETQNQVIAQLDQKTGHPHHEHGAAGFQDWPSPVVVEHQQMHVTAIHRAYLGGLRLMFAAATDNQLLSTLWLKTGFNVDSQVPNPDPNFDYNSAVRQLNFIRSFVTANSSWMQIVKTPAEARQAINSNKLAVVLSLEMDSLTVNQIETLVYAYDVRHVIPIHLANGPFGGSAVYDNAFNTNNWFLNGHQFFQVDFDPSITFRLDRPQELHSALGALFPTSISDDTYKTLGYDAQSGGHKNHLGLSDPDALLSLMQAGVMIDVAHMSEKSIEMALTQAEIYGYPLMDSHTGIRNPQKPSSENERSLLPAHATRIGNLGGVIGLGPAWDASSTDPVADFSDAYQAAQLILGGRGVAIGTDANGLQPLIAFTKTPLADYQHNVAAGFGPPAGVATPDLGHYVLGTRTYDVHLDGLPNYGMLPDFLEALTEYERQSPLKAALSVTGLFHSAEDVIAMWERALTASANAIPPRAICGQPTYSQCITSADNNFTTCKKDWDGPPTHATTCTATLQSALTTCFNQYCQVPKPSKLAISERVFPVGDAGRFTLSIDGAVQMANVGDQASTGFVTVKVGTNVASESGANGTDLNNYVVQFDGDCSANDTSSGHLARSVTVGVGQQKSCSIINLGYPSLAFGFVNQSTHGGKFNILVDQTPAATDANANGYSMRLKTLTTGSHVVSLTPGNSSTSLSNFAFRFTQDCAASAGNATAGVVNLSPGDAKTCKIFVLDSGQNGCPAGEKSCGNASGLPGDPPVCVQTAASCNSLCPVSKTGARGVLCDLTPKGTPVCVYPPAACP